jgi:hypothetical protein
MIFGVCIGKMNQQLNFHNFFKESKNNNEWNDEKKKLKIKFQKWKWVLLFFFKHLFFLNKGFIITKEAIGL